MVALLTRELKFPAPSKASADGLLAVGGDLSPERLVLAYRSGIFPWPLHERVLTWFSPDPRAILEFDDLHISSSLAKRIRKGTYEVRIDTDFESVIRACASRTTDRPTTWIVPEVIAAYIELFRLGYAHSIESWKDGQLVGGLYGISMGGLFAGESMYARAPDASKVALVALVQRMRERGMSLLDVQVPNPHLESLGSSVIPRTTYLKRLKLALAEDVRFV